MPYKKNKKKGFSSESKPLMVNECAEQWNTRDIRVYVIARHGIIHLIQDERKQQQALFSALPCNHGNNMQRKMLGSGC